MPLKKLKSVFKSITKPFKKVLRSPIGKLAGLAALYYGAPMLGGYGAGGAGWKKMLTAKAPWLYKAGEASVPGVQDFVTGKGTGSTGILANLGRKWGSMGTLGKAATIGGVTMAADAIGDEVIDETKTVVDTSGHEGYLKARKNFVDEWADWYMQQGDDEETAYAKASEAMFNDGGIVGLAQGGRIGMAGGAPPGEVGGPGPTRGEQRNMRANVDALQNAMKSQGSGVTAKDYVTMHKHLGDPEKYEAPQIKKSTWDKIQDWNRNFQTKANKQYLKSNIDHYARHKKLAPAMLAMVRGPLFKEESDYYGLENVSPLRMQAQFGNLPQQYKDDIRTMSGIMDQDVVTREDIKEWLPDDPTPTGGDGPQNPCDGPNPPAYCFSGVTAGASTPKETVGDYYGFSEWADWDPVNTSPLFGDATQYKALLNKGGRIGLYAGGMGGMNNPMNPMMNQGLGAMGSSGMNPFNQQNLMAQAQMRGNPMMARGNPMMAQRPGIPAQGPGISGTQAAAKMAKKEDDGELLKLIRMLASMGIPMEQLRGRTKEELVEMAISLQKDQPTGRPEVVEESEEVEEVVEAAGGGIMKASYDYNDAMGESWSEFKRLRKLGEIPLDLEFDEWLEMQDVERHIKGPVLPEDPTKPINPWAPKPKMMAAHGGRVHAAEGYGYPNPEAEFMSETQLEENYPGLARGELGEVITEDEEEVVIPKAGGGLMRTRYAMGSEQPVIPSKDGPQLDFRNTGGYQPHGKAEKHDDVRALLAQGEFVVTSDAVKGIGGGDRDLGAKRMYDMMHKFEPIGRALS